MCFRSGTPGSAFKPDDYLVDPFPPATGKTGMIVTIEIFGASRKNQQHCICEYWRGARCSDRKLLARFPPSGPWSCQCDLTRIKERNIRLFGFRQRTRGLYMGGTAARNSWRRNRASRFREHRNADDHRLATRDLCWRLRRTRSRKFTLIESNTRKGPAKPALFFYPSSLMQNALHAPCVPRGAIARFQSQLSTARQTSMNTFSPSNGSSGEFFNSESVKMLCQNNATAAA